MDRQRVGIELQGLTKEFQRGVFTRETQVAVDHLTFNVQRGDIFALLGHNGAGKSTTISMLTGALPATSGDARLLGCSIMVRNLEIDLAITSSNALLPSNRITWNLFVRLLASARRPTSSSICSQLWSTLSYLQV